MSFHWNLRRELLLRKNIHRPVDLQALLQQDGFHISLPAVCALIKNKPKALPLKTAQALCNSLDCTLNDLCTMEPDRKRRGPQRSDSPEDEFPDPFQFPIHECD